jgi:hypothetical protein
MVCRYGVGEHVLTLGMMSVVVGASVLIGLSALAISNYSGVCLSRAQVLSSDELIKIASRDHFNGYPDLNYTLTGQEAQHPVKYLSYEDFMTRNPGCCTVTREGRSEMTPSIHHYLLGRFAGFVRIEYILEENTTGDPKYNVAWVAVTNCGTPWNGIKFR